MDVLRKFTTGLYILGVDNGEVRNGMTASWVTQVSFEPPLVMVAVKKTRFSHDLLHFGGKFTINVLRKDQKEIVGKFKGNKEVTPDSIGGVPVAAAGNGAPFLLDSAGYVECTLVNEIEAGDHSIFIGEVTGEKLFDKDAVPLISTDYEHIYGG
jgi:flavin reductase (DIM6/NTAB) family NADH-FMN oxidoreductase RutF